MNFFRPTLLRILDYIEIIIFILVISYKDIGLYPVGLSIYYIIKTIHSQEKNGYNVNLRDK